MLTTAAIDALLKHIYQNLAWANVGDAAGLQPSAAAGNFYISLHTADPGAGGSQTTNEATYTGYARIPIVRSASGFTVASGVVSNAALAAFAACTGGTNSITHFGIGSRVERRGQPSGSRLARIESSGRLLAKTRTTPSRTKGMGSR
jgi:hypothetical protein